jgi:hypothetical protein
VEGVQQALEEAQGEVAELRQKVGAAEARAAEAETLAAAGSAGVQSELTSLRAALQQREGSLERLQLCRS